MDNHEKPMWATANACSYLGKPLLRAQVCVFLNVRVSRDILWIPLWTVRTLWKAGGL